MTWTYAPAPESAALANLQPAYRPFIDGEFVDGNGSMKTVNPATEEVLAEVGTASSDDVDRAVAAARRAYETTWGPMPGAERAKYLFRIAGSSPSGPASWPCWRRWTTASRSASRATSTSRRRRRTCSTTRAGPTSWSTRGSGHSRNRSAWSAR